MYIRKTKRVYKGKSYTNHLLVESVLTAKGPRQRTICSLGSLEPAPCEQWLALAHKLEGALRGPFFFAPPAAAPATPTGSGAQRSQATARLGHSWPTGKFAGAYRYR